MTVEKTPSTESNPRIRSMLTITVTDDLDLTKYDPNDLVTARLQTPFRLDDDAEAETFDLERQRQAEQDLQSLLTPEQRERRREYIKVRARAEFEQYKKMVDHMGDPAELQAKITALSNQTPLRDVARKMFSKPESPLSSFQPPRASAFTDEQLKEMGAGPGKLKPKRNRTQEQLDSLVEITSEHRNVLRTSVEVMGSQLSELQNANTKLQEQADSAEARARKSDSDAADSKFWARLSGIAAVIAIAVAIGVPVVQHFTQSPASPAPQPTIEQEKEAP